MGRPLNFPEEGYSQTNYKQPNQYTAKQGEEVRGGASRKRKLSNASNDNGDDNRDEAAGDASGSKSKSNKSSKSKSSSDAERSAPLDNVVEENAPAGEPSVPFSAAAENFHTAALLAMAGVSGGRKRKGVERFNPTMKPDNVLQKERLQQQNEVGAATTGKAAKEKTTKSKQSAAANNKEREAAVAAAAAAAAEAEANKDSEEMSVDEDEVAEARETNLGPSAGAESSDAEDEPAVDMLRQSAEESADAADADADADVVAREVTDE